MILHQPRAIDRRPKRETKHSTDERKVMVWLSILTVLSLAAGAAICTLVIGDKGTEGKKKREALYRATRGMSPRNTAAGQKVDSETKVER